MSNNEKISDEEVKMFKLLKDLELLEDYFVFKNNDTYIRTTVHEIRINFIKFYVEFILKK